MGTCVQHAGQFLEELQGFKFRNFCLLSALVLTVRWQCEQHVWGQHQGSDPGAA